MASTSLNSTLRRRTIRIDRYEPPENLKSEASVSTMNSKNNRTSKKDSGSMDPADSINLNARDVKH